MTASAQLVALLCLGGFALSVSLTGLVRRYAASRLLDVPNERSSHAHPKPRGGGLGFLGAFALVVLPASLASPLVGREVAATCGLIAPLAVVSLLDDRGGLPRLLRFAAHLGVAGALVIYFGPLELPVVGTSPLAFAFSVIGVTAIVNFYNFMDGIDGLVAGVALVQFGWMAAWLQQPQWALLSAALLGFLVWNWSPSKIFMGDIGSTVLGALAAASVLGHRSSTGWEWYYPVLFLPLVGDAVYTIVRRILRREDIFTAHHSHIYQRLMRGGLRHATISTGYIVATALIGAVTSLVGTYGALASVLGVIAAVIGAELHLHRIGVSFAVRAD